MKRLYQRRDRNLSWMSTFLILKPGLRAPVMTSRTLLPWVLFVFWLKNVLGTKHFQDKKVNKKNLSVLQRKKKKPFCCCLAPPTEGSVSLRERYSSSPLCPSPPPPPLVCMMMFREIITEISLRRWRHCYYMLPGVLGWVETQKTKRWNPFLFQMFGFEPHSQSNFLLGEFPPCLLA